MLLRDATILQQYAQVSGNPNFDSFKATIRLVEDKYIKPIIGRCLYDALDQALDGVTESDTLYPDFVDLLDACCRAIGPLTCYLHADKSDVKFSDNGMQRVESTTFKSAFQEQRTKFKEANLTEGEEALEFLIQFLEDFIGNYPEWTDSDEFLQYRSLFINSGSSFKKYFPSSTPYRNYFAMRSVMQEVEENIIEPFLGTTIFENLKLKLKAVDPLISEEESKLIDKLCRTIAYLTVSSALPLLNVKITSNGLTIPAVQTFSQNEDQNIRSGVSDKMYSTYLSSVTASAQTWFKNLQDFIVKNKTAFPDWPGFDVDEEESGANDLKTIFGI